jgi:signal transduction histidine kinase
MPLDLATVLNTIGVGVFVSDDTGTLILANNAALEVFGAKSIEELRAGHDKRQALFDDGAPIPSDSMPFPRALAGEEVVTEMEVYHDATRGTIALRTRTCPMRDPAGEIIGAVKVAIDVSKEYELARVRDEFVRQAAHELKTPITIIKANAEALTSSGTRPTEQQLQALVRGVERMDGLINSLLDLLDLQGGFFLVSRVPTRLDELLDGAIARLPAKAARRIHLASVPILIQGDPARIRRAIYSILDNALKYSPTDSSVDVALTSDRRTARLQIRDRGVGIPADKQSRIFEKFFRAHAGTPLDAGGIGVGLYIAREIIVQHGGRIWFESDERGTVFHVELPIDGER